MLATPRAPRTVAFVDGQNLFHAAREAFGYGIPNYDVSALASAACVAKEWNLVQVRFYTGIPSATASPDWHRFWTHKLAIMGRHGVATISRRLSYRTQVVTLPDGTSHQYMAAEEKGIDVRIALDVVRLAHKQEFDVALVFSQDQDLSELAYDIREIAREQRRWIKIASAYPLAPSSRNRRGIERTDWIPIDRAIYDACIDQRDYWRKAKWR